jgi:hypothetical protein
VKLDNVTREDWIVGGLAILLLIDLLALPWFSVGGGSVAGVSIPSVDLTATDTPDGWLGILAVIATLGLLADLAIERLSPQTQVPAIGNSRQMTRFVLAAAAAVFMALKFLFHINHFSDLGFGFWAGAVLVAALLVLAMQAHRAGPGVAQGSGPGAGLGGGSSAGRVSTGPASTAPPPTTTGTSPAGGTEPPPSTGPRTP